jgi:catalase
MMEGFGVHTFRFVNAQGKARFVKFHWKPLLGTHSLVWDEAQKLAGKDPDWLRRDLWDSIEKGNYPEYELGVQIVEEEDEFAFDFDLLDATKIIPEELVPVRPIGKMVLNRNPDNFFAETEQVAFHPGHVVPGIDFTNDPLLQGRLFSYLDTQLIRLGGPNFAEIPINRPVVKVNNNQRDGFMRQTINKGQTSYSPNSLRGNDPQTAPPEKGGYVHYAEKVEGRKVRARSESFNDHYTQARMFWNSLTPPEQQHLVEAFHFELGKVDTIEIRQRMVDHFAHIDEELAMRCAKGVGIKGPSAEVKKEERMAVPVTGKRSVDRSEAISVSNTRKDTIKGRRIAILAAEGIDLDSLLELKESMMDQDATVEIIAMHQGSLGKARGKEVKVDKSYVTTGSIMYDAVFVPGGKGVDTLITQGDALQFINEAFRHCKPIGAVGEGVNLLQAAHLLNTQLAAEKSKETITDKGVVTSRSGMNGFTQKFVEAIAMHRHWERESFTKQIPA